jgi:hypothetical protein
MKKILFALMSLLTIYTKAQITLDYAFDTLAWGYTFKPVQISATETKYFIADTTSNSFSLYNMDLTPFITNIAVPEPFFYPSYMQALYITRTLFDCDSTNIEYAFYSPSNRNKPFRILRTDGTIIFQKDSANGPYCYGNCLGGTDAVKPIVNTSAGAKLFLQAANPNPAYNLVYSLCGTLPNEVFDFIQMNQSFVQVFPNPSTGSVSFQINPPDNMNQYELVIFDNNTKEVKREQVKFPSSKYQIELNNLKAGTYFYSLCTKDRAYQSGKFTIIK